MKRFVEWLVLLIFSPLLIILLLMTAAATRIALGSPVIFQQVRPGQGGQLFKMYKFRTMTNERDRNGALLPDEVRLTRFGKFLRSTSLDELPSLLNFVRGEIALVGPRPLLPQYLDRYTPEQARRHEVRPGLTGWAQVNGRNAINWEERLSLDVWYVENRSIALDLKILFLTVWRVLAREGVSQEGMATMSEFKGEGTTIGQRDGD